MVTIVYESHALTPDNEARICSGWYDVDLSERGRRQAKELGEKYKDETFEAIFCSDLQRAVHTAEIAFGDKFPFIQDKRLRECDYGDMTRGSWKTVKGNWLKRISTPYPNGESFEDVLRRMQAFLDDLKRDYDGKKVMIIGHGGTQFSIVNIIQGIPLNTILADTEYWQRGRLYELK